jgi:hypothetical protein
MSKRPEGSGALAHLKKMLIELQGVEREATTRDDAPGLKPDCPFSCPTGCSLPLIFQPEPNDPQNISAQHENPSTRTFILSLLLSAPLLASLPSYTPILRHLSSVLLLSDPGRAHPRPQTFASITPQKRIHLLYGSIPCSTTSVQSTGFPSATRIRTRGSPRCCLPLGIEQSACS